MANTKISALTAATTPLAGTEVLPVVQSSTTKQVSVANLTAGRALSATGYTATNGGFTSSSGGVHRSDSATESNSISNLFYAQNAAGTKAFNWQLSSTNVGSVWAYNGSSWIEVWTADTSGNLKIPTQNIVQGTAAKGINFTANTGAAGKTSQLLNWYEEGTWTPTIAGTTSAGTGTYSTQTGRYTRIGNRVYINLYLSWSAHTGTGNMRIDGLPFTSVNVAGTYSALSPYISALTLTAGYWLQPYIGANRTYISLEQVQASAASIAVPMDTSAEIIISGFYEV